MSGQTNIGGPVRGGGKTRTKKGHEHVRDEHVDNGTEATMDDIYGECGVGNPGYNKQWVSEKRDKEQQMMQSRQ